MPFFLRWLRSSRPIFNHYWRRVSILMEIDLSKKTSNASSLITIDFISFIVHSFAASIFPYLHAQWWIIAAHAVLFTDTLPLTNSESVSNLQNCLCFRMITRTQCLSFSIRPYHLLWLIRLLCRIPHSPNYTPSAPFTATQGTSFDLPRNISINPHKTLQQINLKT